MIIPIKCFTCGNILASKYERYLQLLNAKEVALVNDTDISLPSEQRSDNEVKIINQKQRKTIVAKYLNHESEIKPIEAIILDKVGLKRYCCRRHFVGHVNLL